MTDSRHGAHTGFEIHLHVGWVTKYRRPALTGEVAGRVRDLIRELCGQHDVTILKGQVAKDPVPRLVSIPPQGTISRRRQGLKGQTADTLRGEFAQLRKTFWGRHLWARGDCCCSSGNVTDEVMAEYLANQSRDRDEDCTGDG